MGENYEEITTGKTAGECSGGKPFILSWKITTSVYLSNIIELEQLEGIFALKGTDVTGYLLLFLCKPSRYYLRIITAC